MKKRIPWIVFGIFALWILAALRPTTDKTAFHLRAFGSLPAVANGRVQPLDSIAMNALLSIRGQRSVPLEGNADHGRYWGDFIELRGKGNLEVRRPWQFSKHPKQLQPTEWLLELATFPERADQRYVFLIKNPDLVAALGLQGKSLYNSGLEYFAFADLDVRRIQSEATPLYKKAAEQRSGYERSILELFESLYLYTSLKNGLTPEWVSDFEAELKWYTEHRAAVGIAFLNSIGKETPGMMNANQSDITRMSETISRYSSIAQFTQPLVMPPIDPAQNRTDLKNLGETMIASMPAMTTTAKIPPAVSLFAKMTSAYRSSRPADFNSAVEEYRGWFAQNGFEKELRKGGQEYLFNQFQPFYKSMAIYVLAFILGCIFWLNLSETLRKTAYGLVCLAFVVHTTGLLFRMFLEGRPPVTNLYSSAIFVGWGAVLLGLILERFYRDSIGIVVASLVGFSTLIIAHHLSLSGDTMEMMRAVLDTNFWLATHVVMITTGYASMFVAGVLATVYIVRGFFTRTLTPTVAKSLTRMVYGIVCFATLFSFVGTILGGIWADQSWGRFWGWDPKENGALLIVICCALTLHARWGGMVRERGLMALAVWGNIVTSFSWFGVNMLGVGLHSYGFMDAAFTWLMIYVASQAILIGIALMPLRYWLSFQGRPAPASKDEGLAGVPQQRPAGA